MENGPDSQHPVIRTLYDHIEVGFFFSRDPLCIISLQEVTCVAFHPREQILISGSNDFTLKMFDYSKTAVKRAMKTIFVSPFHACACSCIGL